MIEENKRMQKLSLETRNLLLFVVNTVFAGSDHVCLTFGQIKYHFTKNFVWLKLRGKKL